MNVDVRHRHLVPLEYRLLALDCGFQVFDELVQEFDVLLCGQMFMDHPLHCAQGDKVSMVQYTLRQNGYR